MEEPGYGHGPSVPPPPPSEIEARQHFRYENNSWEDINHGRRPPPPPPPAYYQENGQWNSSYPRENEVLGLRLAHVLGDALTSFWRASHTVLRLDLRRAIRWEGPHVRGGQRDVRGGQRDTEIDTSGQSQRDPGKIKGESERASSKWVQGIQGGGARIKLMQVWDFPNKETGEPGLPWGLNIGFGADIQMDEGGHLVPKARLQTKHAALHILPSPRFELRSKFPLGGTPLVINIRYRIPLTDIGRVWDSPAAQLTVNFYSQLGSGFHFTPGGLEFDEHVLKIGKYTTMRVAASLLFPRRIPPEEGERPFRIEIHRLGLKTRMM